MALPAVDRPAHGIAKWPRLQRRRLHARVHAQRRVERRLALAILDELERPEEAAATDVADMGMAAEVLPQPAFQALAHRPYPREDPVVMQAPLHGERARARRGVPVIRGAVLEEAASRPDRLVYRGRDHRGADRLVARAETLGDQDDVGHHAFRLERPRRAAAAHAAHHLVQDEEDAVAIADLAHAPEIA